MLVRLPNITQYWIVHRYNQLNDIQSISARIDAKFSTHSRIQRYVKYQLAEIKKIKYPGTELTVYNKT